MNKRFINEAIRIRSDYFKCLEEITNKEELLNKQKKKVELIIENLKGECEKMDDIKKIDEKILNTKLLDIEAEINIIQKEFIPIHEKIEKLKIDAKNLISLIKLEYPEMSDEEIRNSIQPYFKDIKN